MHPVTIAFLDLEGVAARISAGDPAVAAVVAVVERRVREAVKRRGGEFVKSTPGGFMLAFASAPEAVACVLELQESAGAGEPAIAAGLHCGETIREVDPATGRTDHVGPVVNRAARIAAAAHPRQTLLSGAVHDAAAGAAVTDLGEYRLRGIERTERIFLALPPAYRGLRFPPLRAVSAHFTNIPSQTTTFVGREREVREILSLLDAEPSRIVVVTGTAGVGKSRLAVRAASERLDRFEGGVWHADVSETRDAAGISAAVAAALGVPLAAKGAPAELVSGILEYRKPLLLIIDGLEAAVAEAPATVGLWAKRAPQVRWLVASRVLPELPGLAELRLGPLEFPARGAALAAIADSGAVRLFVDRAREMRPDFELTAANSGDVAEICAELEGLPLALELAAARVKILQPAMMLKKLAQKFQLLKSSRQDTVRRQQTLSGAIDWSYDLLSHWEQAAFRQASVFRGGMTAAAADAVVDLAGFPGAPRGSAALESLVARSLLERAPGAGGPRFRMPRTLRDYAEAKGLEVDGAAGRRALEARHALATVEFLEQWQYRGRGDDEACLQRQQEDLENALAAQTRCLASGDAMTAARAIRSVVELLNLRGPAAELTVRLEASAAALRPAAADPGTEQVLVLLLLALASAQRNFGNWDRATACSGEAVERARRCGAPALLARALVQDAAGLGFSGHAPEADARLEEAERALAGSGATLELAEIHNARGATLVERGNFLAALESFDRARPLFRQAHSRHGLLLVASNSAAALIHVGDLERALAECETGEALARALGNRALEAVLLDHRGGILSGMGDFPAALGAYDRACELNRELGRRRGVAINEAHRGEMFREMGNLDRAAELMSQSESILAAMGDRRAAAGARNALAMLRHAKGEFPEALALLEEPVRYFREQRDSFGLFGVLASYIIVHIELRKYEEALRLCQEATAAAEIAGAKESIEYYHVLAARATVEAALGRHSEGVRIAREAVPEMSRLAAQFKWRGAGYEASRGILEKLAAEEA